MVVSMVPGPPWLEHCFNFHHSAGCVVVLVYSSVMTNTPEHRFLHLFTMVYLSWYSYVGVFSSFALNVTDMIGLKSTFNLFVSFLQYVSISTFFILPYFGYWIFFKKNSFDKRLTYFYVCQYGSVLPLCTLYIPCMHTACVGQQKLLDPWSWSYMWLGVPRGCWEPNWVLCESSKFA